MSFVVAHIPAPVSLRRLRRPGRSRSVCALQDDSTFGKPAAPKELWSGFARTFRDGFLEEMAKPDCDVARAALLLAGEDDAVTSRTAVPLPVDAYLGRLDSLASDFMVAYCDTEAHEEDRAAQLDTFLYDHCRFRTPTAWTEVNSPYRTYLHHVLAQKVGRLESLAQVHCALLQRLQHRGVLVGADVYVAPGGRHPVTRAAGTQVVSTPVFIPGGWASSASAPSGAVTPRLLLLATLQALLRAFWAWEWRPEEPSGFLRAARAAAGDSGRTGTVIGSTVMQASGRPFGDLERAQLQLERLVALAQPEVTTATRDLACLLAHRGNKDLALNMLRDYVNSAAGKDLQARAATSAPALAGAALPASQSAFAEQEQAAVEALLLSLERSRLEKTFTQQ